MAQRERWTDLAWAGWRMTVPADWRPLGVDGTWQRGRMMVGDAAAPLVQVKWLRPRGKRFRPERWARKRLRKASAAPADAREGPPEGFDSSVLGRRSGGQVVWAGCAAAARLALELVIAGDVPRPRRRRVLSSLAASEPSGCIRWAVFDASFVSPPGFVYGRCRLNLGDIALGFDAPGARRLTLRQVYPAGLALSRRDLPTWLRYPPFPGRRALHPKGDARPWSAESFGRRLEGVLLTGIRRWPMPVGLIAARRAAAGAVVEDRLDRLLVVEYESPRAADEGVLARAVAGMNWARLGAEGDG